MELTRDDLINLHMTFSIISAEQVMSEEARVWLKDFKERINIELQKEGEDEN